MSRADILGCEFVTKSVPLPGGKSATVRELSAGERGEFFDLTKRTKNLAEIQAWLVRWGSVNADGSEAFTDADVPVLIKRPSRVLQPLSEEVLKLSGLAEDESKNP
jgi:hypothetical protein